MSVLKQMLFPGRGATHQARLEAYYGPQAKQYDTFRRRLLHGRPELFQSLEIPNGACWLDMGAGTGTNLDLVDVDRCQNVTLVDLSPSLQTIARDRIRRRGWTNVECVEADATRYRSEPVDRVTFSYSLTMMPDWFRAIDCAWDNLKPGGLIGATDFYVSRKFPAGDMRRHKRLDRIYWPLSFSYNNVMLSADHLPYLRDRFETVTLSERAGRMPGHLMRAPYYVFVGRKPL